MYTSILGEMQWRIRHCLHLILWVIRVLSMGMEREQQICFVPIVAQREGILQK